MNVKVMVGTNPDERTHACMHARRCHYYARLKLRYLSNLENCGE